MAMRQNLHADATRHLDAVERLIDALKNLGPCPLDGWNALTNIRERLTALARRG